MIPELRRVFERLGFYSHPIAFSRVVTDDALLKALTADFPSSQVAQILRALPDLFVLHPDMRQGIFFVRHTDGEPVPQADAEIYRRYYPNDILLTAFVSEAGGKRLVAAWIGDKKRTGLVEAISRRFKYQLPKHAASELARNGWLV
jgi:hypothetical protein